MPYRLHFRKSKRKIVYAYLVADIFHLGHLKFLQNAKKQGDYLIVGALSDKACMEKKAKPIISFNERKAILKSIGVVDEVINQNEYSPMKNIKKIRPDVLIESDSHPEMPANKFVELYGGRVEIVPYYNGQSSTDIKNKIIRLCKTQKLQ